MGKHTTGGGRRTASARIAGMPDLQSIARGHEREIAADFAAGKRVLGEWEKVRTSDARGYQRTSIDTALPDGSTASVSILSSTSYQTANRLRLASGTKETYSISLYVSSPPGADGRRQGSMSQLFSVTAKGESSASNERMAKAYASVAKKIKKSFGVDITNLDVNR